MLIEGLIGAPPVLQALIASIFTWGVTAFVGYSHIINKY